MPSRPVVPSIDLASTFAFDTNAELASAVQDGKNHLYARVDVIPDDDGSLMLSELEMLEPSLFFPYCERAVEVFVRGVEKRMAAAQS